MNLQQFTVARNGTINVNNFPRYTITGQLQDTDPATGITGPIAGGDFTGVNALSFPAVMTSLTPEQRDWIIQFLGRTLIEMRAGVWTP